MNPPFPFLSLLDLRNALRRLLFLFFFLAAATALLGQNAWPDAGSVAEAMTRANNYWMTNNPVGNAGWARAAYFTGNQRAARALTQTASERAYVNWALAWGNTNQWLIGPEITGSSPANAFCCGQTYLDLFRMDPQPLFITSMTNNVNTWVASSATNQLYWIDAFYMAGPTFARMGNLTGNTNYFQKLWQMYSYMKDGLGLFDASSSLWYRDATFVYPKAVNADGGKVFWSRGNGWVFAGLAQVLQQMSPSSPHYQDYVTMFQTMAPALKAIQGPDGMWRSSLYDTNQFPNPETSGTGFFTYGLAWGIRSGLLPAADYTNSVILAWNGLTNLALNANGLVGWVQNVGSGPAATTAATTTDFGVGAFLLACSEIELLATNGPVLSPWAGADQALVNTNANPNATPQSLTLDGSQTEIYRGPAGNFTWWEGANQIAAGTNVQVSLSLGQHVITLQVPGVDGITYTDSMTVTVSRPPPPVFAYEAENLSYTTNGAVAVLQTGDANASGGQWLAFEATGVGQYIQYTVFNLPAGTYDLQMSWKGLTSRGISSFTLDGTVLGNNLDQYSSVAIYPTTDYGIVTFTNSGNHTIRLTVVGKNPSASGWWISTDRFILTQLQAGLPQAPNIGSIAFSGSNLIFTGANGIPQSSYHVLTSTNVALPLVSWTAVATNVFDANGNFTFTNAAAATPQQFYLLQLQLQELP